MSLEEKTLQSELIYQGKIIRVSRDTVILPDGAQATREVVRHPVGVGVVALTEDGKVLLVRQWRYPFQRETIEIPAGKREPGEPPQITAERELLEETGYQAKTLERLGEIMVSPGFCNEVIHLYLAEGLTLAKAQPDEDEFVELMEVSLPDALTMVYSGELTDAKTVAGLLIAARTLKQKDIAK